MGRRKNVLFRKLCREFRTHALQFLAILSLCFIGTWIFSGFDTAWRSFDSTFESYFSRYDLFDVQLSGAAFGHNEISRVKNLPGVASVRPRTFMEVKRTDSAEIVYIFLWLYDGPMDINAPCVVEGEALNPRDRTGCLMGKEFADAQGLKVGDDLRVEAGGVDMRFVIRGLIRSPEYPRLVRNVIQDAVHNGYVYANKAAFPWLPINNLLIRKESGADVRSLQVALHGVLPDSGQVSQYTYDPVVACRYFPVLFRTLTFLFPLIALIVAAVIVFNTLKRLIGDERMNIGLMRSLGYTDAMIFGHYVWYPLIPSFLGSLAGLITGRMIIPRVLWRVITHILIVPELELLSPSAASYIVFIGYIVFSVLICLYAFRRSARESEASLLRPKPPRSGKRILFERLTFIWKRLSVNSRIVMRNLSRDKARVFISVLAVLACNMLIICAFCLGDSIESTIGSRYGGLFSYDYRIELIPEKALSVNTYRRMMNADRVEGVMEKLMEASSWTNTKNVDVYVLEQGQKSVRLGPGGTYVPLPDDGVVISRKLAEFYGVGVGDDFFIVSDGHEKEAKTKLRMITETTVGHGVFMSRNVWDSLNIGSYRPNVLFVSGITPQRLNGVAWHGECDRVIPMEEEYEDIRDTMTPASLAFAIMSAVALGLTFIICFDMSRLKFVEHRREYASMRVLGYRNDEIIRQIMMAALIVSCAGTLLGVLPGIYLTKLILDLCEQEYIVFAVSTPALSVVAASLISCLYSLLIELLYALRVRRIDMVESLQSLD